MDEVKNILALFDSAEKWNAFIELSKMREAMVDELKSRLSDELQKIANKKLVDSGWELRSEYNGISIRPIDNSLIGVKIGEWRWWNDSNAPWCRRGACIWLDANSVNSSKTFELIKLNKKRLPLQDYEENIQNHYWFPFVKQIPSRVFNVDDNITSVDECLYMAKDNAEQLARNLWKEVFQPFATKENADLMRSFVCQ
ncbi:MAG: hypothetical protein Q4E49_00295 [Bacteroidales bacterium]|nr:hypothetical protein [Bacteroidales bacterium]